MDQVMDIKTRNEKEDFSKVKEAESSSAPEQSNLPHQSEERTSGAIASHPNSKAESRGDHIDQSTSEESHVSNHKGSKPCTLCHTPRDILIRCQIDQSKKWHFICTGSCWKGVSGGVVDGDGVNKWYRYGGMWKNKHEGVSAKIKGKAKKHGRGKLEVKGEGRGKEKDSNVEIEAGVEDGKSGLDGEPSVIWP